MSPRGDALTTPTLPRRQPTLKELRPKQHRWPAWAPKDSLSTHWISSLDLSRAPWRVSPPPLSCLLCSTAPAPGTALPPRTEGFSSWALFRHEPIETAGIETALPSLTMTSSEQRMHEGVGAEGGPLGAAGPPERQWERFWCPSGHEQARRTQDAHAAGAAHNHSEGDNKASLDFLCNPTQTAPRADQDAHASAESPQLVTSRGAAGKRRSSEPVIDQAARATAKRRRTHGGTGVCEHQRIRSRCKDCGGSSICEHQRIRSRCKDCGGSGICEHQRQRSQCKDCGGSSICEH